MSEVSSLLRNHPEIDVNWTNPDNYQWTPLHAASRYGHVEVVKLLLAHPNINVNLKNRDGQTSFLLGCHRGRLSVVRMLLKDPRVDVTLDDNDGCTPLWWASWCGERKVIEWLIASGRDLGDIGVKGNFRGNNLTALEMARHEQSDAVSVLEKFIANPAQTRHELRVKLGVSAALAAELFAVVVFLSDDLLQPRPALATIIAASAATRFFAITSKLPMELQMILCHRVVGSMKQNILYKDSESPSNHLRSVFLWPHL